MVGVPISNKTINAPIGRHPKIRTKQAINQNGKEAITRISVSESFKGYALLKVNLETGRTCVIGWITHTNNLDSPRQDTVKELKERLKTKVNFQLVTRKVASKSVKSFVTAIECAQTDAESLKRKLF